MRLLLDENLSKRLKLDFPKHEIFTVRDKGWNGIKNGKLLQLMLADSFHDRTGNDPYCDYLVACFWEGEVKVNENQE